MREFRKEAEKLSRELDTMLYYDKKKLDQEMVYNNGKEDEKIEIVKNLINQKISIDVISKATGLSKEEIKNFQGE